MSPLSEHAGALERGAAGESRHPFLTDRGGFSQEPDDLPAVFVEYAAWVDYNFGKATAATRTEKAIEQLLGVVEEVGELAHSVLKSVQAIRGTQEEHERKQRDACADIVFFLLGFCYRNGWDLEQILLETWAEVRERDWIRYPQTGKEPQRDHS